jgi:hypothetical protein
MLLKCPAFTHKVVLDQLEDLCSAVTGGLSVIDAAQPIADEERRILRKVVMFERLSIFTNHVTVVSSLA